MFAKNPSRLFVFKFLSLFSAEPIKKTLNSADTTGDEPIKNSKYDREIDLYKLAKFQGSKHIQELMLVRGVPGMTICVAKGGDIVWRSAFGFCDVENQLECVPDARMRVASISKTIFASTVIAPMVEQNKLDIKHSIHKYLSNEEFPKQEYKGKQVDITIEQLLSHTSGIEHYKSKEENKTMRPIGSEGGLKVYQCDDQYNRRDFFQRKTYRNVLDALEVFRDGLLVNEPGKFTYTTYGYILLSAVAQKAHQLAATDDASKKEQIEDYWMKVLRRDWDLKETSLDQEEPIISNRARYYMRTGLNGGLINAPSVDNSNKWAGGGLISSAGDLVKFGMLLIDSYKSRSGQRLKRETIEQFWTVREQSYCLGFFSKQLDPTESSGEKVAVYHTGHGCGAVSVLVIYPESEIVVAILANLESAHLTEVGFKIANIFAKSKIDRTNVVR